MPEPIPACDLETVTVLQALLKPDSNCVDIGANRGSILREILRLSPSGEHWAFEPIPKLFRLLQRRFSTVRCHRLALTEQPGTLEFNYFRDMDGFSGLKKREVGVDPGRVERITVRTERLDSLIPTGTPIRLIKIDVEGAELGVLQGASEVLRRQTPAIIFECGKGGLDLFGHTPDQVFQFLAEIGYTIQTLTGWKTDGAGLRLEEFRELFWNGTHYMFVATHPNQDR